MSLDFRHSINSYVLRTLRSRCQGGPRRSSVQSVDDWLAVEAFSVDAFDFPDTVFGMIIVGEAGVCHVMNSLLADFDIL